MMTNRKKKQCNGTPRDRDKYKAKGSEKQNYKITLAICGKV
jgi:hypothetical protein